MISRRYVMGTLLTVSLHGRESDLRITMRDLLAVIQNLEERLSVYRPSSEISEINHAAGDHPVPVSADTFRILEQALQYAHLTDGAFDPTAPSASAGNFRHVEMNPAVRTVLLTRSGMRLDLGGIGKGYAMDQAIHMVESCSSVESLVLNFGGQWSFWNRSGVFPAETIAIESPTVPGQIISSFEVSVNCSISTSSQGERPGHVIDPRSGQPACRLESVTVVAPMGTEAEVLSTALFVQGTEAPAFLQKFPQARAFVFPRETVAVR